MATGTLLALCILVPGLPRLRMEAALLFAAERIRTAETAPPSDRGSLCILADELALLATDSQAPRAQGWAARALIACARADYEIGAQALLDAKLAQDPADAASWLRRAHTLSKVQDWRGATQAWNLSVRTGRFDPILMPVRIEAGIILWPFMDQSARDSFREQIRLLHDFDPPALFAVLTRYRQTNAVQRTLDAEPAIRTGLDRALPTR